jgi:2-dehydro-3-deoxyphosphogluconate aldolase/(4S)-4-hydroxy-2-oxoglutarate aldolase
VIRTDRAAEAVQVAGALLAGGIRAVELTFTIPGAAEALVATRNTYGKSILLGAGTIREPRQVEGAARAGVDFLVSSHLSPAVLAAMLETGLPALPGVFTPSEVAHALDLGAEAVKLFPASTGGPAHLRALRGPFPDLQVVPTGGIELADLTAWFAAGAFAVGVGGELAPRALMREGRWEEITRRAEQFAAAARPSGVAG